MPDDCSMPDMYETTRVILIVEDEEEIGTFLAQAIALETLYHPVWVLDGFAALKLIRELKPDPGLSVTPHERPRTLRPIPSHQGV
jgi:DNA-binding NtrC family response regulator